MAKGSMFLYGKNSVLERLNADAGSIKKIFMQENFDTQHILNVIRSKRVPFKRVSERELARIKRADRLQRGAFAAIITRVIVVSPMVHP